MLTDNGLEHNLGRLLNGTQFLGRRMSSGAATRTDARGVTAEYSYDALNRLTAVHYPDDPSRDITYTYDQSNTGSSVASGDYNAGIGRLTRLEDHSGITRFRYDDRGNLIEDQRTVTVAGSRFTYSVQYQYNLAGQVTGLTYPDGTEVTYSYNAQGEVTRIDGDIQGDLTDTNLARNIAYQPFGPVRQMTWGNGLTLTRSFDQDGRIQRQVIPGVQDLDHGFDANSNITRIVDGIEQAYSATFGYDKVNRLISEETDLKRYGYDYDGVGNRLEKRVTDKAAGSTHTEDYDYGDTSNRLMSVDNAAYQYDAVGNTVHDGEFGYDYDVTNRMSSASKNGSPVAFYRYNAMGQRVVKFVTEDSMTTVFAYNQRGQLVSETAFNASREIVERKHYVWLGRVPVAQLQPAANDSDYEVLYLHGDHLNTPRTATNADRATMWQWRSEVFGSDLADNDPDMDGLKAQVVLRFPGQYADIEVNSSYNYFRNYNSDVGRYLQSDPIGLSGGDNTYAYAGNNPVINMDLLGLWYASLRGSATTHEGVLGASVSSGPAVGTDSNGDLNVCWQTTVCANTGVGVSGGVSGQLTCSSGSLEERDAASGGVFAQGGKGLYGRASARTSGDSSANDISVGVGGGGAGGATLCETKTVCW